METENDITCRLFDQKLKMMCRLYPITYFEDKFEKIKESMMGLCTHASKGYVGIDMPSLYRRSSFNIIGQFDDQLIIRDKNEHETADIMVVPKKMIIHIDDDMRKNYIMLISDKGIKYDKGINTIFFEHISGLEIKHIPGLEDLLDKGEIPENHDVLNIHRENYPILIHPLNSTYNTNNNEKELLFSSHRVK